METTIDNAVARHGGGHGMLVIQLRRTYHPDGTNGTLLLYGKPVCHSIELPWRGNRRNESCIPEGRYRLRAYRSRRFGPCLRVDGVCCPTFSGFAFGRVSEHKFSIYY